MSAVLLIQATSAQMPLEDKSCHCIVTSPPYFGLRTYGDYRMHLLWGDPTHFPQPRRYPLRHWLRLRWRAAERGGLCCRQGCCWIGALGNEGRHDCLAWARDEPPCNLCYICHLRTVMQDCWRVLRDDGTLWLNIADSYNANGRKGHGTRIGYKQGTNRASKNGQDVVRSTAPGLKPKDLCGIPQRLVLAIQADGWYWRKEIIWHKPNPMPSSATDRPTVSHEPVFLFSKKKRYFYDATAIAEPCVAGDHGSSFTSAYDIATKPGLGRAPRRKSEAFGANGRNVQATNSESERRDIPGTFNNNPRLRPDGTRKARSVWTIATEPTSYAHFATMPTELARRCILAGTSEYGVCPQCQAPWERQVEKCRGQHEASDRPKQTRGMTSPTSTLSLSGHHGGGWQKRGTTSSTTGWLPTCRHYCTCIPTALAALHDYIPDTCGNCGKLSWTTRKPAVVLDPFAGSGTTAQVARERRRDSIGLDLSYPYLHDIARDRLSLTALQAWEQGTPARTEGLSDLPLFANKETS